MKEFNDDFLFKNKPDESTPLSAENLNIALENTRWLKYNLESIQKESGSIVEINNFMELNRLEIEGKSYQETRSGKNLIDIYDMSGKPYPEKDNIEWTVKDNKITLKAIGTEGSQLVRYYLSNLDAAKTYTFSFKAKKVVKGADGNPTINSVIYYSDDGASYTILNRFSQNNPAEGQEYYFSGQVTGHKYYRLYFYNNASTPVSISETTEYYDIQFEEWTEVTDYEPFGASPTPDYPSEIQSVGTLNEQGKYEIELKNTKDEESTSKIITLNEPLNMLSNGVKDLLYIENGRLYIERKLKLKVLTENESWNFNKSYSSSGYINYSLVPDNYKGTATSNLCTHFKYDPKTFSKAEINTVCQSGNPPVYPMLIFKISTDLYPTLDDWKNFLKEQREKNTPVKIVYELVNPITEDLGEIDINIFKDNSILTTTDELNPNINIEYSKRTLLTEYVDNKLSILNTILKNLTITREFTIFETPKLMSNTELTQAGICYHMKRTIREKYPLISGFKRTMTLCIEGADNISVGGKITIVLRTQNQEDDQTWVFGSLQGDTANNVRNFYMSRQGDFDAIPEGHVHIMLKVDNGAINIQRIYWLITDTPIL